MLSSLSQPHRIAVPARPLSELDAALPVPPRGKGSSAARGSLVRGRSQAMTTRPSAFAGLSRLRALPLDPPECVCPDAPSCCREVSFCALSCRTQNVAGRTRRRISQRAEMHTATRRTPLRGHFVGVLRRFRARHPDKATPIGRRGEEANKPRRGSERLRGKEAAEGIREIRGIRRSDRTMGADRIRPHGQPGSGQRKYGRMEA